MSAKNIMDYIDKPDQKNDSLIQTKVNRDFFKKVNQARRSDNLSWHDLLVACLSAYLDQRKK